MPTTSSPSDSQPPAPPTQLPPSSTQSASRRTSTQMLPPPLPLPQASSLPSSPRPQGSTGDNTGVGVGPGPIRHPRPLTAAEIHLELEKEQESIVNRLTRELSALRAQTASVASTTSSTSDHFFSSTTDPYPYTSSITTGTAANIIPTSARRHRSSSNLSARSSRSIRDSLANAASTSVSGVAAPRDQSVQASARPSMEIIRPDMSRQNSLSASGFRSSSITSSPHLTQAGLSYGPYLHRSSISSNTNGSINTNAPTSGNYGVLSSESAPTSAYPRSPSSNAAVAAARYEEATLQRAELESVKRENEMLRAKVRELERSLQRATESQPSPSDRGRP
ncbi:hypothetical protein B0A52_05130 [Exophiala mesophila]|uniref:Uncharacterized protein n=1 Tax=Exophiala mesophila TaxID=212818 RepID=A0A438N709_EXOME|nr:hypothetical protein B0A52_05130 [Exophiala mesophila]